MYGTQATVAFNTYPAMFENDVKMYGTQAAMTQYKDWEEFENDVKCMVHKLRGDLLPRYDRLRMM